WPGAPALAPVRTEGLLHPGEACGQARWHGPEPVPQPLATPAKDGRGRLMARPVLLFSGPWADLPLADLAARAAEWGYNGLELCCWGDHLEVQRALSEPDYAPARLDLLARNDLHAPVVSNHLVGQAVCDPIDARHRTLVPDYVWGDGNPEGVRQRAAEEMMATVRVAQKLGATVVGGFTGSPLWSYVAGWPAPTTQTVADGFREFARAWNPILDVCR